MKNRLIELFKQIQPDFTELFLVSTESSVTLGFFTLRVIMVTMADIVGRKVYFDITAIFHANRSGINKYPA